jgi:hypothetical protein
MFQLMLTFSLYLTNIISTAQIQSKNLKSFLKNVKKKNLKKLGLPPRLNSKVKQLFNRVKLQGASCFIYIPFLLFFFFFDTHSTKIFKSAVFKSAFFNLFLPPSLAPSLPRSLPPSLPLADESPPIIAGAGGPIIAQLAVNSIVANRYIRCTHNKPMVD